LTICHQIQWLLFNTNSAIFQPYHGMYNATVKEGYIKKKCNNRLVNISNLTTSVYTNIIGVLPPIRLDQMYSIQLYLLQVLENRIIWERDILNRHVLNAATHKCKLTVGKIEMISVVVKFRTQAAFTINF
jgi:hypothetical protein